MMQNNGGEVKMHLSAYLEKNLIVLRRKMNKVQLYIFLIATIAFLAGAMWNERSRYNSKSSYTLVKDIFK
jgi:hypothetical protein